MNNCPLTAKYLEESANSAAKKNMEFKGALLLYYNEQSKNCEYFKKKNVSRVFMVANVSSKCEKRKTIHGDNNRPTKFKSWAEETVSCEKNRELIRSGCMKQTIFLILCHFFHFFIFSIGFRTYRGFLWLHWEKTYCYVSEIISFRSSCLFYNLWVL